MFSEYYFYFNKHLIRDIPLTDRPTWIFQCLNKSTEEHYTIISKKEGLCTHNCTKDRK